MRARRIQTMRETMTIRELEKVGTFSHTCVALGGNRN